ncbi:MAG TPA: BolA family protein [Spongiibacteraceae bacterium]|nr:BolA family protein [Spongiibacteraceae bacterium]
MQAEEVRQLLVAALPDCEVEVQGDGSHFDIRVVGEVFAGMNRVKRQQHVYAGLKAQIADGSIHAVNIKALTADELRVRG